MSSVSGDQEQHPQQLQFNGSIHVGATATQLEDMVRVDGQVVADAGLIGIEGNYHELLMATARHQPPIVQIHVFIVHHVL